MTTTQLCTPGKASRLDKSCPAIRNFVSTATVIDGWSILEDCVRGGVATDFVDFAFLLRVAGKCKLISVRRLQEEWPDRAGKQWIKRLVHDVFNLFLAMSQLAKPLKPDQNISDHPSLDCFTKRQTQLVGTTCLSRKPKKEGLPTRAGKRARLVSERLQASCFVLRVDNFKQLCYLRQPSMVRHAGWDATAMADLRGIVLPRQVQGHQLETSDLPIAAFREAKSLFRCYTPFTDLILESWNQDYAFGELPAPLDIVRRARGGSQWQPYDLMGSNISSTPGLAQVLEAVALVRTDSLQDCVPILADMDAYYRILRMMYWKPTPQIGFRNCLGPFPLLFGIWHCYKHVIELLFQRFCPFLVALQYEGFVESAMDAKVFYYAKLIEKERLLLLVYHAGRRLKSRVDTAVRDYGRLVQAGVRTQVTQQMFRRLTALRGLLQTFVPAMIALGRMVRSCAWDYQTPNSGHHAKTVVQYLLILHLTLRDASHYPYITPMCLALMLWTLFHDRPPAAALSRRGVKLGCPGCVPRQR